MIDELRSKAKAWIARHQGPFRWSLGEIRVGGFDVMLEHGGRSFVEWESLNKGEADNDEGAVQRSSDCGSA
jgi:hypothetical protein